jgi:hypothetical protein
MMSLHFEFVEPITSLCSDTEVLLKSARSINVSVTSIIVAGSDYIVYPYIFIRVSLRNPRKGHRMG